ncbi:MAG: MFS transporter [Acidobacteriota bacterium]|nr:MFS transporter [Acidobacteriota bacterium]
MTSPSPLDSRAGVSVLRLMSSACAGMFVFGIVMAVLGAILPSLFDRIRFDKSAAGNLFLYMNSAMLLMSLVFGPVVDRFGFKVFLAASSLLVAASFFLLTVASAYSTVLIAAVMLGFGGGGLNGGTNALASDLHPGRRSAALNLLGIFFGFGALFIPFLIGVLLKTEGLSRILGFASLISVIPFFLFCLHRFPVAKQAQGFPLSQAARVVGNPLLWLWGLLLFFQSGNEFTVGGWMTTYLQEIFHLEPTAASMALAGYWGAIMSGRLVLSRTARRLDNRKVILVSGAASLAAAAVLASASAKGPAVAGAVLIGFGFAAVYPTTLAVVGENFPSFTGTAFSAVFAIALCGGMLSPWLAGRIAQAYSLRQAMFVPVFNCGMIVILQLIIMRRTGHRPEVSRS